jgi:hypothetical protein
MNFLVDFLPIVVFYVTDKFVNLYSQLELRLR